MNILVAVHKKEKKEIVSSLKKLEVQLYILDTLTNFNEIAADIQLALIDEDFDGLQTGWKLAQRLRRTGHSPKIVMIVKKNPKQDFVSLYDVTLGFPISEDELINEIRR